MTSKVILNFIVYVSITQIHSLTLTEPLSLDLKSVKIDRKNTFGGPTMREMNQSEYMATCGSVFDIEDGDAIISTPLTRDGKYLTGIKCSWTIAGSHYCRPQIQCDKFDIRKFSNDKDPRIRCRQEYLEVTDGLGGEIVSCDRNAIKSPFLTSIPGYDMYIELKISANKTFDRSYDGINCTISCRTNHPLDTPTKMPQRGFKRRVHPNCTCGERRKVKNTKLDDYPWHVAVVNVNTTTLRCSGTLINNFYVLTTASCLMNNQSAIVKAKKVNVILSVNDIGKSLGATRTKRAAKGKVQSKSKSGSQSSGSKSRSLLGNDRPSYLPLRMKVSKIIPHEGFNTETLDFDICLLRLWYPLDLADKHNDLRTVCLPTHMDTESSLMERFMTSIGWSSQFGNSSNNSRVLKSAHIPLWPNRRCEKNLHRELSGRMICAGYFLRDGNETCVGDIGSPLIDDDRGNQSDGTQIGILSNADGCGADIRGQLGVYTKLSSLMQWIYHQTYDATWCTSKRAQV